MSDGRKVGDVILECWVAVTNDLDLARLDDANQHRETEGYGIHGVGVLVRTIVNLVELEKNGKGHTIKNPSVSMVFIPGVEIRIEEIDAEDGPDLYRLAAIGSFP